MNLAPCFTSAQMFDVSPHYKMYELSNLAGSGEVDHSHDYVQMWFVTKGACSHVLGSSEYVLLRGEMFFLPPNVVHRTQLSGEEDTRVIGCEFSLGHLKMFGRKSLDVWNECNDFAFLDSLMAVEDARPYFRLSTGAQDQASVIFEQMLNEYNTKGYHYETMLMLDILKLILILAREHQQAPRNDLYELASDRYVPVVKEQIAYLERNFTEPISLDDMCQLARISKTYFCTLFKRITGQTFTEYLLSLRIKKSIELLTQTDRLVADICFESGFRDVTHFCRTFKKQIGVSAGDFRRRRRLR